MKITEAVDLIKDNKDQEAGFDQVLDESAPVEEDEGQDLTVKKKAGNLNPFDDEDEDEDIPKPASKRRRTRSGCSSLLEVDGNHPTSSSPGLSPACSISPDGAASFKKRRQASGKDATANKE